MSNNFKLENKAQQLFELEGFEKLTPIQEQVYVQAIKRRDLIAQSATGTGKTHAYLFPLIEHLNPTSDSLQAIIIAPTRELSMQIFQFAKRMTEILPDLRIELITGGMDRLKMKNRLETQPHVAIGTPGRIKDMFFEGILRCDQASTVILDEADMIYEYGFLEDVDLILSRMNKKLQVMVFSATIPPQMQSFMKRFLNHPLTFSIEDKSTLDPQIKHILVDLRHKSYQEGLLDLLTAIDPAGCIIFANTRVLASEVAQFMRDHGINTLELHGDMSARQRQQTLNRIQNNELVYLVATDIAARGLDLPHVSHIISLGFPSHLEFYTHRAGRTGRAGKSGYAYVLVDVNDKKEVDRLKSQGLKFSYQAVKNRELVDVSNFYVRRKRRSPIDPEIIQILNRKKTKVKPNYRKKRAQEIEKLQKRKRREMIQKSINEQKKKRAIEKKKQLNNK